MRTLNPNSSGRTRIEQKAAVMEDSGDHISAHHSRRQTQLVVVVVVDDHAATLSREE